MAKVTLPGGEVREVEPGSAVGEVLAGDAVCARVDGQLVDLSYLVQDDMVVEPVTASEPDGLHVLRHSTAHVMAQAVCDLFPGAKYAIGPPIDDGFYYDFELPRSLTPEDLERVEARMREIAAAAQPFVREELDRAAALELFADQPFKREIIETAEASEGALGDRFSVYRNNGWADLCLGPHVPSTDRLAAFKLLSLAGAYWRGDEKRPQLQRIYGTAWATEDDLAAYLHRLEEAKRRDHRRLGRELDLFSFPDELGAGLLVWHPRGGMFRKEVEDYIREVHLRHDYAPVFTPHIAKSILWETSGHLAKYSDNMYPPMKDESTDYYVKPMNCPFHVLVYKSRTRSYRDLPMRLFELGTIYRHELLGTLHGVRRRRGIEAEEVMRVRAAGAPADGAARLGQVPGRDEPGLARVRVETRLEERLACAGLVGHRGEQAMHARARGSGADARQKTECAIGAALLAHRPEQEDHPLRTLAVVHERRAA